MLWTRQTGFPGSLTGEKLEEATKVTQHLPPTPISHVQPQPIRYGRRKGNSSLAPGRVRGRDERGGGGASVEGAERSSKAKQPGNSGGSLSLRWVRILDWPSKGPGGAGTQDGRVYSRQRDYLGGRVARALAAPAGVGVGVGFSGAPWLSRRGRAKALEPPAGAFLWLFCSSCPRYPGGGGLRLGRNRGGLRVVETTACTWLPCPREASPRDSRTAFPATAPCPGPAHRANTRPIPPGPAEWWHPGTGHKPFFIALGQCFCVIHGGLSAFATVERRSEKERLVPPICSRKCEQSLASAFGPVASLNCLLCSGSEK